MPDSTRAPGGGGPLFPQEVNILSYRIDRSIQGTFRERGWTRFYPGQFIEIGLAPNTPEGMRDVLNAMSLLCYQNRLLLRVVPSQEVLEGPDVGAVLCFDLLPWYQEQIAATREM